jgi:mannose-1-phosphate guanylyltransferase
VASTTSGVPTRRIPGFHAVVPAGGAGTRLWPLSRAARPKFLHDLTGSGRTLIQSTWDRLEPLTGPDGILVVTGVSHAVAVARQLPGLTEANLLVEPAPRNSGAAIGLAAAILARRDPRAVLGSFAADHVVRQVPVFQAAVAEAVAAARTGALVTIGIDPTGPATGFGYIDPGARLEIPGAPSARGARAFVEKPDAERAARYVEAGWVWNAGMFVARATTLVDLLVRFRPDLADGLSRIADAWETDRREEVLAATWPGLPSVAIDHAAAEPAAAEGAVVVVPASFGWDDVGDWTSLGDLLPATVVHGDPGNGAVTVLGPEDRVVAKESSGVVVPSGGRLVVVVGIDDVVVVDTLDAVLVTTRTQAQQVKDVVELLKQEGRSDLV